MLLLGTARPTHDTPRRVGRAGAGGLSLAETRASRQLGN